MELVENLFGDVRISFIFQHHSASAHTGRNLQNWLDEHDVQAIHWPAKSSDLNVIENISRMLQNWVIQGPTD